MRCGWSVQDAGMQLGEDADSWGYGGTAMKSTKCQFVAYGVTFGVGDVIGCFLVSLYKLSANMIIYKPLSILQDLTSDPVVMSYTVNGVDRGIAFKVYQRELKGRALFPHILTKNQDFSVNFGQMPAPLRSLLPGHVPIGQLDVTDGLVRGPAGPLSRDQCEVSAAVMIQVDTVCCFDQLHNV
jgi:heterogeneous nuclear ribonucleoprotein U-like protein 1